MTPEQRAANLVKARAARARPKPPLRRDFLDEDHWLELARTRGIRLPAWHVPVTTGLMRRYLRKIGLNVAEYLERHEDRRLTDFHGLNPDWPARAWVGLLLEETAP